MLRLMRRFVRKHMKRESDAPRSSSILGGFGIPRDELAATFRGFPGRPTPAQVVAALLVPGLILHLTLDNGALARIVAELRLTSVTRGGEAEKR